MIDRFRANSIVELVRQLKEASVPEDRYQQYIGLFFEQKAREKRIPLSGSFELTPLCNLDCKMCYVHLAPAQLNSSQLLSADTWKALIQEAYRAGMRRAALTGGECLTYPGFDEVYLALCALGIRPGILSNGILIDADRLSFFRQNPPDQIQISLYGSSEDAYERVTGHRCHQTVIRNLLAVRDAGIPVRIAITPNRFMTDDIDALLEEAESFRIPYYINAGLITPRETTGRQAEDVATDFYIGIHKRQNELKHIQLTPPDPEELPEEAQSGSAVPGLQCGAGRSSFGIRYDGKMCPCLSLSHITAEPLKDGFAQAWEQIKDAARQYPAPTECSDCSYRSVCVTCAAIHKSAERKGHCDRRICERFKKLAAAGLVKVPDRNAT